jgi:peptidoglycan hydrolase-like protein with peptidoglycan-binding domain
LHGVLIVISTLLLGVFIKHYKYMFMYNKAFILGAVFAFSMQLVPAVASAQYGGGGIIGGPMSIGYTAPAPTPTPAPAGNTSGGSVNSSGGEVLGASAYNFANNIHSGQSGTDVTELQKVLIAGGYLHIVAPTGWFGPMTLAAVKKYQAAKGIQATGFVGPLTRAVLNKGTTTVSMSKKQSLASSIVGTVQNLWGNWEGTRAQ